MGVDRRKATCIGTYDRSPRVRMVSGTALPYVLWLAAAAFSIGCNGESAPAGGRASRTAAQGTTVPRRVDVRRERQSPARLPSPAAPAKPPPSAGKTPIKGKTTNQPPASERRQAVGQGTLFGELAQNNTVPVPLRTTAKTDLKTLERRARDAGIRRISGRHLTLFTDLPEDEAVDRLPQIFDLAYPQWCRYFQVSQTARPHWRMIGCLMVAKERFVNAQLLPEEIPDFLHGYTANDRLWMNEQPTAYYRRHLMLHEGTHGFMVMRMGGCGPPWYMEGIAELMATHRLDASDGAVRLELNHFPASRDEVPYWGRIRIVKDGFEGGTAFTLSQIFNTPHRSFLRNEPYGWTWAAAAFLDGHPAYQKRFRRLWRWVSRPDFGERTARMFSDDMDAMNEQWQVFVANLEYGYDLKRMAIEFQSGAPLDADSTTVIVRADRGWQSSGVRVDAGETYQLTASGRYQVATEPKIWWCEPGGVSIRYYKRLPLGILIGAVRPDDNGDLVEPSSSALLARWPIGLGTLLKPQRTGTLYLRINDSAAELHDNEGSLEVVIRRQ